MFSLPSKRLSFRIFLAPILALQGACGGSALSVDAARPGGDAAAPSGAAGASADASSAADVGVDGESATDTAGGVGPSKTVSDPRCGFPMPNPVSTGLPNPASHTMNADGTMTDNVTGLIWELTPSSLGATQPEAARLCAAKGPGWRLPTRLELVSLIDYTLLPADDAFFPLPFWTSTTFATPPSLMMTWEVDEEGPRGNLDAAMYGARCVWPPPPKCFSSRYEIQSSALVVDHATGLTWQRHISPGTYTWPQAIDACTALGSGWRLPSPTEVETIVDETQTFPAIDADIFFDTPSGDGLNDFFWTSARWVDFQDPTAWAISFVQGGEFDWAASNMGLARCVR